MPARKAAQKSQRQAAPNSHPGGSDPRVLVGETGADPRDAVAATGGPGPQPRDRQSAVRAITDAVTQANVMVLGTAPALSLGQNYLAGSQAQGLLFANMVQSQGALSQQGRAFTQEGARRLLDGGAPAQQAQQGQAQQEQAQQEQQVTLQRGPLMEDAAVPANAEGATATSLASGSPVTTNTNVTLEGLDQALQTLEEMMRGRPVVT